jgi:purine-binding chemotaxis protein CheW
MKQYLSFNVGDDFFLISIDQVNSIIKKEPKEIRPLPDAPKFFLGLTQLRESTIGILSAAVLFGKEFTQEDEMDVVIIKTESDQLYGIIVDTVQGVLTIDPSELQANDMMSKLNKYVLNIYRDGDSLYLVIDANRLVEIKNVKEIKDENTN